MNMAKGKNENDIKDLDLRDMPPFERHLKIFEKWDSLKEGQTLRITNDHDPKPLHYQFEAEYNSKYEWEDKKEEIKELLKQLHSGGDIKKIKEKGKGIFNNVSPIDLALIEQEIIHEG